MKPLQFQGGKDENAYKFLTLCHKMLEVMGLVDPRSVRFVALQLKSAAREWWRTYMKSRPVRSPSIEWGVSLDAF